MLLPSGINLPNPIAMATLGGNADKELLGWLYILDVMVIQDNAIADDGASEVGIALMGVDATRASRNGGRHVAAEILISLHCIYLVRSDLY